MFFRGIFIYFIMQMFRRGTPTPPVTAPDGTTVLPRAAATNLFTNGTLFVSLNVN